MKPDEMNNTAGWIRSSAKKLSEGAGNPSALVGFDGFVDVILHLVAERYDAESYKRMESMRDYADRVSAAAGYSANIEMVPQVTKLGGNGPILADGLNKLGCRVTYCGAIGEPDVHPVFNEFGLRCEQVISVAEPAHTDALEFIDGKLMMGQMQSLREVTWANILRQIPERDLITLLGSMDLVAGVNWTMLPYMNGILKGLQGALKQTGKRPRLFIDLTDPRKRTREDIREVCCLLSGLQDVADVILGMNEHESAQVEQTLLDEADMDLRNRAIRIRESMGIDLVVIHPLKGACVASADGVFQCDGPFTAKPKLTTGAGDTFNAGFCRGLLAGLHPFEAIGTGFCASGFYVREARAPTLAELSAFMIRWADGDCGAME